MFLFLFIKNFKNKTKQQTQAERPKGRHEAGTQLHLVSSYLTALSLLPVPSTLLSFLHSFLGLGGLLGRQGQGGENRQQHSSQPSLPPPYPFYLQLMPR